MLPGRQQVSGIGPLNDAQLRATPVGTTSGALAVQLDEASSSVTYVGGAAPGSATSSAAWQIKKITTTGADIAITWADGDAEFDNVWDDRATLTYS